MAINEQAVSEAELQARFILKRFGLKRSNMIGSRLMKIVTLISAFAAFNVLFAVAETKLAPPPFSVTVTLSQKAAMKLQGSGETITIAAYYFGDPIKAKDQNGSGDYSLGNEKVNLLGAGTAKLGNVSMGIKDLAKIKGHNASVNINIYSSRKVFADNLLQCEIFEDTVTVAAQKPITLPCKLIGE